MHINKYFLTTAPYIKDLFGGSARMTVEYDIRQGIQYPLSVCYEMLRLEYHYPHDSFSLPEKPL